MTRRFEIQLPIGLYRRGRCTSVRLGVSVSRLICAALTHYLKAA